MSYTRPKINILRQLQFNENNILVIYSFRNFKSLFVITQERVLIIKANEAFSNSSYMPQIS